MTDISPLLQLHAALTSDNLTEKKISELSDLYEGKIHSLPTKESISSYAINFLKRDNRKLSASFQRSFLSEIRNKLEIIDTCNIPLDTSPDTTQFARSIYSRTGRLSFHPYLENLSSIAVNKKVTLATSLFKCSEWIEIFLENFCQQIAFSECQLILFDCERNSEHFKKALPYLIRHENIIFIRLSSDPKLYNVWNMAASMATTKYMGNLNHDDLRHPLQVAEILKVLEERPEVSIASTSIVPYQHEDLSNVLQSGFNEIDATSLWAQHDEPWFAYLHGEYTIKNLFKLDDNSKAVTSQCIPHCAPIWRRSLHTEHGYFNEVFFSSAADWGFWLSCLQKNKLGFIVGKPYTYYFVNPQSYMRRDSQSDQVVKQLCDAYNAGALDDLLKSSHLDQPRYKASQIIDLAINLPQLS
jgi:hypothetical protein